MSKEIPAHIFLKLTLKYINPQCVVHELHVGPGAVLRVVGDPDNGGYEWVIESVGSELVFSDCAYGQSAVALRDGLIAWFGLSDGYVSFAPKAAPSCDALCNDARTKIDNSSQNHNKPVSGEQKL